MSYSFRHATCNEIYSDWKFADACRSIKSIGYEGIEIAPFTLADAPADIAAGQRRQYRSIIQDEGLTFVGLHWLMAAPSGLHVTTPDETLRRKSWDHVRALIDLSADLSADPDNGGVMVFGSPKQRCTTGGLTREQATRNFVDGMASVAAHAEQRNVKVLFEALPVNQCDVLLSLAEAVDLVKQVGSPAIRTIFDTHNAVDESEPHATLVDRYFDYIRHVHVNEIDGGHPGTGDYDFVPVLETLARRNYRGWVSLEAFHYEPGAETIAAESLAHLRAKISQLNL